MNFQFFYIILINFLPIFCKIDKSDKRLVSVKIIEEPIQYLNSGNLHATSRRFRDDNDAELKPKYKPADFSGPNFFNQLNGQCFEYLSNNYKWNVCPFQNVTQFEQNLRWEPFKGVIGIWYEWEIIDEKFTSLLMLNGDDCGKQGARQAKIYFECNQSEINNQISEISEPSTCKYEIKFKTSLVCEQNYDTFTWNVYAYLNDSLKLEWNHLFTNLKDGLITEKMYNMSLKRIYEEAGFIRTSEELKELEIVDQNKSNLITNIGSNLNSTRGINNLNYDELNDKYKDCQKENKRLRELLKESFFSNSTSFNRITSVLAGHLLK
ncbi:unnamed protein product [Brachionus calyciflorus]|uniref:MRH domain-containing protein n=1 Tax=Brachionus calyciflorus TaxID=104777 RepID=A0A813XUD7_9BILA|nr:unnamed protein product [Brachionus calyciflorus]